MWRHRKDLRRANALSRRKFRLLDDRWSKVEHQSICSELSLLNIEYHSARRVLVSKPKLNADQYLLQLNSELHKHEFSQEGMAFIPYPEGTSGNAMTGYSVTGPVQLIGVYAQIAHIVAAKFDLTV